MLAQHNEVTATHTKRSNPDRIALGRCEGLEHALVDQVAGLRDVGAAPDGRVMDNDQALDESKQVLGHEGEFSGSGWSRGVVSASRPFFSAPNTREKYRQATSQDGLASTTRGQEVARESGLGWL